MRNYLIVGLCVAASLPCAPDDQNPAIAESPPGFRERYPDAARLISAAQVIPNLDSGYVPQGIGWSEELQVVVLSYYDPGGKRPLMVAFIDHASGRLLTHRQTGGLPGEKLRRPGYTLPGGRVDRGPEAVPGDLCGGDGAALRNTAAGHAQG